MGSFVRKVKTASGATAVQIVHKRGKVRLGIDHIGSAHDEAELELLLQVARERLADGQDELDLAWDIAGRPPGQAVVQSTASTVLWEALVGVYSSLGFDVVGDECFRQLVLARVVEPTSKVDSIRVLEGLGITPVSLRTITRTLPRINDRDYRDQLARACWAHVSARGAVALVMYDVTTLYFEAENEDGLRKVGMSKERRVDPQITVGLLVDPSGFPLDLHVFEGNKAETTTLLPVIEAFQARHQVTDMVVVADAGMLSAANLNALEDAGLSFIVAACRLVPASARLAWDDQPDRVRGRPVLLSPVRFNPHWSDREPGMLLCRVRRGCCRCRGSLAPGRRASLTRTPAPRQFRLLQMSVKRTRLLDRSSVLVGGRLTLVRLMRVHPNEKRFWRSWIKMVG